MYGYESCTIKKAECQGPPPYRTPPGQDTEARTSAQSGRLRLHMSLYRAEAGVDFS